MFWNKLPNSFMKSTDNPNRLIFACGSRGNYVFDLEMVDGKLKMYTYD